MNPNEQNLVVNSHAVVLERRMMEAGVSISAVAMTAPKQEWSVRLHRANGTTEEVETIGVVEARAPTLAGALWLACQKAGLTHGLVPPTDRTVTPNQAAREALVSALGRLAAPEEEARLLREALALAHGRAEEAQAELAKWKALVLDKPEDRLFHAEDGTWWRRDHEREGSDGPALVAADPPPEVHEVHIVKAPSVESIKIKVEVP